MNMGEATELNLYVTDLLHTDCILHRNKLTMDPSTETLINRDMNPSRTIESVKPYFSALPRRAWHIHQKEGQEVGLCFKNQTAHTHTAWVWYYTRWTNARRAQWEKRQEREGEVKRKERVVQGILRYK